MAFYQSQMLMLVVLGITLVLWWLQYSRDENRAKRDQSFWGDKASKHQRREEQLIRTAANTLDTAVQRTRELGEIAAANVMQAHVISTLQRAVVEQGDGVWMRDDDYAQVGGQWAEGAGDGAGVVRPPTAGDGSVNDGVTPQALL